MRNSSLVSRILAVSALVLTLLVFVPVTSQAVTVESQGNTATGIKDLEYNGVFYDVTFVYQTGNSLYGPKGEGDFPFAGLEGEESAATEEATYGAGRAIQEALNLESQAITRVGPQAVNYFLIAGGEENTDPGNPDTPWVYAAFASTYYDTITTEKRPEDTWVPADTFFINIELQLGGGWPPIKVELQPWPFGMMPPLEQDVPYSWAKIEPAAGSPPPTDTSVGGSVTGLLGDGLVLQNNGADDETITGNGAFTFDTLLTPGTNYSVTVKTQPSDQFCRVSQGWGTVPAGGVADVLVTCGDVPPLLDEIIATWSNGLWYWDLDAATWTQLSSDTTNEDIAAGDFTGDGIADVAAIFDFGPASNPLGAGVYYLDGALKAWTLIPNSAPPAFNITAGDVTGDGRPEIIGTWSVGIWYWDVVAAAWTELSTDTTNEDIAAGDFTGDGIADVAAIFQLGPASNPLGPGLYYLDGASKAWTLVPNSAPAPFSVTAGDVTGDGRPEIIGTWSVGIWYWDVVAADWTQLSTDTTTEGIAAGNFVSNGIADVAAIFQISPVSTPLGSGLYYLNGVSEALTKLPESAPPPFDVTAGDVTGN